jgi:general secretion pathway protein D
VVPLRYVAAAEMERILKAIAPNATLLRTDTARNLLVVSGTRAELDSITDAVSVFDVDWMRGMSFGLYPLESADPEAVAQELDTVFANDRDSPSKGIVRFIPNRRLKSVLVISSRAEYLRRAQTWVRRLDSATQATVKQVFVYPVRSRSAPELAKLLQRIYGGQDAAKAAPKAPVGAPTPIQAPTTTLGSTGATGFPGASSQSPARTQEAAPAEAEPGAPAAPTPTGATLPSDGLRDDRYGGISVIEDEPNNSLIITATAQEYRRVREILERIDVAANQVLLEATIAEVRLSDQLKMGVRWFFQAGNNGLSFTDLATGTPISAFPGFSHFFNTNNIQVVINALNSVTDVNIISSPTLMVLDNEKATLQVGNEVPIVTQTGQAALGGTLNSVTYRSTGIVLNITPRIGDKGRILLKVEQEASDVVKTQTSGIDSPTIQQRRIKTSVAVNDGEALVLGGLIQERADNLHNQMPLIGQVPVLGNLFKNKDETVGRTELLVAITPRIVKDATQARGVTEEFRNRINLTTRPQRQGPPDRREQIERVLR